jgi:DNA ligase-1
MFKPMLAAKSPDLNKLPWPMLASCKLDGVRAIMRDGILVSRTLKPIPNLAVQQFYKNYSKLLEGYDGELILGQHDSSVYRRTMSAVMSELGDPHACRVVLVHI